MAYNRDVPATGQSLGETRDVIRGNFQEIDDAFKINHTDLGTAGQGKHEFLQMPEQAAANSPVTAANEGGLYTKVGTNVAETNLFFKSESGLVNDDSKEYQLTTVVDAGKTTFGTNTTYDPPTNVHTGGWTFLPGGLILQYGINTANNDTGTVTFPLAFPTAVFSVTATTSTNIFTTIDFTVVIRQGSVSKTQFIYNQSATGTRSIHWMAIGN